MKILGVNGIRTDGHNNTDLMLADLAKLGWTTADVQYPLVRAVTARSRTRQLANAQHVVEAHNPGDAVVAHSYGCLLTLRAMELGARFSDVFFFAPAMDRDFTFPYHGMRHLWVMHDRTDLALSLGAMLWWHDFGDMGEHGYGGPPDNRVVNVDVTEPSADAWKHSHYFEPANRPKWVGFVDRRLQSYLRAEHG